MSASTLLLEAPVCTFSSTVAMEMLEGWVVPLVLAEVLLDERLQEIVGPSSDGQNPTDGSTRRISRKRSGGVGGRAALERIWLHQPTERDVATAETALRLLGLAFHRLSYQHQDHHMNTTLSLVFPERDVGVRYLWASALASQLANQYERGRVSLRQLVTILADAPIVPPVTTYNTNMLTTSATGTTTAAAAYDGGDGDGNGATTTTTTTTTIPTTTSVPVPVPAYSPPSSLDVPFIRPGQCLPFCTELILPDAGIAAVALQGMELQQAIRDTERYVAAGRHEELIARLLPLIHRGFRSANTRSTDPDQKHGPSKDPSLGQKNVGIEEEVLLVHAGSHAYMQALETMITSAEILLQERTKDQAADRKSVV